VTDVRADEDGPQLPDPALMEILPGGVVYVRADGTIARANREALRVLGLSYDELTRKYAQDFEPQTIREDGSPFLAAEYPVTRALTSGEPQRGVTIGVRRPDGELVWAVFSALPLRHPKSGAVIAAIVTFVDITERKRTEQALQHSRELLHTAQRIAQVGAFEWDIARDRVELTDQACEIYGVRREDLDGVESAFRLVHPEDVVVLRTRVDEMLRGATPTSTEYRIVRPDGQVRTVWSGGNLTRDEHGRPSKMIGAVQDVTERRALEEQLRQSQRLESLGRLAGGVAHDFNNLLQVILGSADIARRDPTRTSALREIQMAAERAAELTRQLLAFGRRQHFQPIELSVPDLIDELLPLLRRMLGERVPLAIAPHVGPSRLTADRGQIEQVLINLCLNARDAMPGGGTIAVRTSFEDPSSEVREQLELREPGPHLVLRVVDTGSGVAREVRARMFEPFFTTKDNGTGLGLAVVYGIVQQHRGGIDVQSTSGQGTTFAIYLPVTAASG
jgi:two-component system cell cycle sensor histidine kinase/response regulator CckA